MTQPDLKLLSPMQTVRRGVLFGIVLAVLALFAVVGAWPDRPLAHEAIEWVGLAAILACIAGRSWSTLYIGGRKGRELVDIGPYSLCRNPLYSFSVLGAFGFGAQTGSLVVGALCAAMTFAVFRIVVLREERFLTVALGAPYLEYLASTPRFMPSFAHWRTVEAVEVRPHRVTATFLDSLPFLLSIPIAEALEKMQGLSWLPVLLNLP